ncbi:MAG TPA: trypsin-like peptidase domain-containing protein [Candidatus Paceibacterota bacterium]|nr:trypsin-like peptidase domain-containing protein [Candidatus Paceibacterota bacterium]
MTRFAPFLGIVIALALGAVLAILFGNDLSTPAPIPAPEVSGVTVVTATSAPARPATMTRTSPAPAAASKPAASAPAQLTAAASGPTQAEINAGLSDAATALRSALVNILCYSPAGSGLHSISGSGVIVDPKGIILTNAHVAQYFLLADRGVSCTVRTGSPAKDAYDASLIYLPPTWVHENANVLTETAPSGTGEHDYALLGITDSATDAPLPATFPSASLGIAPPPVGTPVVIGSYGAQFLQSSQVESSLFPTIVFGSVKGVFTFAADTVDVLALGGSAAAQEGSSGGGVADAHGTLVGTITTSTVTGSTATRELDAITASYVRADYATENGAPLDLLLAEPTAVSIAAFAPKIPALEAMLTAGSISP